MNFSAKLVILLIVFVVKNSNSHSAVFICPNDQILHLQYKDKAWIPPENLQYKPNQETEVLNFTFNLDKVDNFQCGKSREIEVLIDEKIMDIWFYPNGYIKYMGFYITPMDYCIKSIENKKQILGIKLCMPDCTLNEVFCISKCCPIHQMFAKMDQKQNMNGCITVQDQIIWKPKIYENFYKNETTIGDIHFIEFLLENKRLLDIAGRYNTNPTNLDDNKSDAILEYRYLKNHRIGIKYFKNENCRYLPKKNVYCLDGFYDSNDFQNGQDQFTFIGLEYKDDSNSSTIRRNEKFENGVSNSRINKLYGGLAIISSVFLLLVLTIYIILWKNLKIHGWCIFSLSFSMLLSNISLIMVHFTKLYMTNSMLKNNTFCYAIGVFYHYFFLTTFVWLGILCFHMFCTFRYLSPSENSKNHKKFTIYSIFGWIFPLTIVILALILDQIFPEKDLDCYLHNSDKLDKEVQNFNFKPGYGKNSCLLDPKSYSQGLYMYYPAAFILCFNFLFFIMTTYKILKVKRETSLATKTLKNREKQEYILYVKLFFLMGVNWIFEVISWAHSGNQVNWAWTFFDIVNLLQGLAIFIIFICNREIFQSLQKTSPLFQRFVKYSNGIFMKSHETHSMGTLETDAAPPSK